MAILRDGALLKLLKDMKSDEDDGVLEEDPPKPILLQIRSIVPVLEEGDLWPNRGFFLKVADSTHALYVSLSEEQNEMVLGNQLKLGQFIYAQKLKKSHPVPLLKGVTPIPGRRPCDGTPEDIILSADFEKLLEASAVDTLVVEKGVILEKKISNNLSSSKIMTLPSSDTESTSKKHEGLKSRSSRAFKARRGEILLEKIGFTGDEFKKTGFSDVGLWPRSRPSSIDNDSDGDSVISTCSSRASKRRSWQESEILGVKEIFDSTLRHDNIKLLPRSRSANVSPVRSVRYDSSDDNSSFISRRRSIGLAKRLIGSSNKTQVPVPKKGNNNSQKVNYFCGLVSERKGAESGILWDSLPSNLVKMAKEVVSQRDNAMCAAADALQEVCASERLLNHLSTLSQFPPAEAHDLQLHFDRFINLHHDLARTALITRALATTSPSQPGPEPHPFTTPTNSIKDTLDTFLERKKNAIAWLKSAVALDLSTDHPAGPTGPPKKRSPSSKSNEKSKCTPSFCVVQSSRQIKSGDMNEDPLALPFPGPEDRPEWTRGSGLGPCTELVTCLGQQWENLFFGFVERYLDEVGRRVGSADEDEGEVAGLMCKVKMVSDLLDLSSGSRGFADGTHERVRSKIYEILIRHVQRTAMGFERANGLN